MIGTEILLSGAHFPVTVLGHGRRLGIWLQGCSIGCKGCVSKDTWSFDRSTAVSIGSFLDWAKSTCGMNFDGVTVSGGEPFDQADSLEILLQGIHRWFDSLPTTESIPKDIICYSGYPLKRIEKNHAGILRLIDVLISEPFVERRSTAYLRGSDNQKMSLLTPLAQTRYPKEFLTKNVQKMQIKIDSENRMWAIGIPERHLMESMQQDLQEQGMTIGDVSWVS